MKRTTAFALIALWLLAAPAAFAADKLTVVLDWTINTNHTGLYVAQSKGWFAAEGLEIEIQPAPEVGAAALVGSGRAQFAFSSQEEVVQSRQAGVPLSAVAAVIQHNTSGFAAPVRAGIKRPKDFEGKRYGGWGSPMEEAIIKAMMKADGGDPSKVVFVNLGDQDFFAATLKNVDFAWVFEAWTVQEAKGRKIALDYVDIKRSSPALDWYTPVLVANQDWLAKNPALARAFLRALSKGYEFAIKQPALAAAILQKAAPELNAELVRSSQAFLAGQYQAEAKRWGQIDPARWDGFIAWMLENKLIKAAPATAAWFSNDYLPGAKP